LFLNNSRLSKSSSKYKLFIREKFKYSFAPKLSLIYISFIAAKAFFVQDKNCIFNGIVSSLEVSSDGINNCQILSQILTL
jgi:hypothetical protein